MSFDSEAGHLVTLKLFQILLLTFLLVLSKHYLKKKKIISAT